MYIAHCKNDDLVKNIIKSKDGKIRREFPSEYLESTYGELLNDAKSGDKIAKKAKKLLTDNRFNIGDNRK